MQENNVLDDLEDNQPPADSGQFRRALRYLLYALGISLVLLVSMWSVMHWELKGTQHSLQVGMAGVWMFSGLGLSALFRARRERRIDVVFALATLAHLLIFSLSSFYLLVSFRTLFGY